MSNTRRGLPLTSSRMEKIFPKLTPAQIDRIAAHGRIRSVQSGEVLIKEGDISLQHLHKMQSRSFNRIIEYQWMVR